jgi:site-specific DNA-methyltransferase (adenine-specific)
LWQEPCKGFIFWYKKQPVKNWASGEMAWTSFDRPARCFEYTYYGNINADPDRFHPTQKPISLYRWVLQNYANADDKILDTHLGSGSSRIAAYDLGFDFYGWEIDKDYFEAMQKRFSTHISQLNLFTNGSTKQNTTASLFEAREDL